MSPENNNPTSLVDNSIDFRGNPEEAALQFTDAKEKARNRGKVNVADMQCYTDITTNESTFTHALNPYKKYGHKKAFLSEKLQNKPPHANLWPRSGSGRHPSA